MITNYAFYEFNTTITIIAEELQLFQKFCIKYDLTEKNEI